MNSKTTQISDSVWQKETTAGLYDKNFDYCNEVRTYSQYIEQDSNKKSRSSSGRSKDYQRIKGNTV